MPQGDPYPGDPYPFPEFEHIAGAFSEFVQAAGQAARAALEAGGFIMCGEKQTVEELEQEVKELEHELETAKLEREIRRLQGEIDKLKAADNVTVTLPPCGSWTFVPMEYCPNTWICTDNATGKTKTVVPGDKLTLTYDVTLSDA